MTGIDLLAALTDIVRTCAGDPSIVLTPKTSLRDIKDWDSAKTAALVLAIEDRFAIKLRSRGIDGLRDVGDWLRILRARGVGD